MDYCLVYVSTSTELLQEAELATILLQSRRDNARADITGVLLCLHGRILQVLEGKKEAIDPLYERIKQDRRHKNISTVFYSPIDQRFFSTWSMGYETLTTSQLEEVNVIANLDQQVELTTQPERSAVLNRVKAFYNTNRIHQGSPDL